MSWQGLQSSGLSQPGLIEPWDWLSKPRHSWPGSSQPGLSEVDLARVD